MLRFPPLRIRFITKGIWREEKFHGISPALLFRWNGIFSGRNRRKGWQTGNPVSNYRKSGLLRHIFDDCAIQASFTLDTEQCRNIEAPDATIANVGGSKQLTYTVLPGKGIDTAITADVTDFEMGAVSINGIHLNLNVDIDDEELKDKVGELIDAVEQLDDGARELSDGSEELLDGTSSLKDGSLSLHSGIASLDEGFLPFRMD